MRKREEVENALAAHYSALFGGKVWARYDDSRRAYCIRGEGLPAMVELHHLYPNGWSLCDYVAPAKAQRIAREQAERTETALA